MKPLTRKDCRLQSFHATTHRFLLNVTALLIIGLATIARAQAPDSWALLTSWSFQDTNFTSDYGYYPVASSNLVLVPSMDTPGLLVANTNGAFLQYNTVETDATTNLTLPEGTILFWFSPTNWTSTNAGGTGPGTWGRFLEIGASSTNSNAQFFSVYTDPGGGNLYVAGKTNGASSVLFASAPISLTNGQFRFIGLTYSVTGCVLYVDGQVAASGAGVSAWPGPAVFTNGFYLGSDGGGTRVQQAQGVFDDMLTFDGPVSPGTVAMYYEFYSIPYTYAEPQIHIPPAPSEPLVVPTFQAVTGLGNLQILGGIASCTTSSNVWFTNIVANITNGTANLTFGIAGGTNGMPFDVFATAALSPGDTNYQWAWMGQGCPCTNYMLTNLPVGSVFMVLGWPGDPDADGLTTAYELLVSHTNPNVADTSGDGMLDGWKAMWGLEYAVE